MRVRHFDLAADLPHILACMPELYEANFPDFVADSAFVGRKRAELREANRDPGQIVLVAEDEQGYCGFIWLSVEVEHSGRRRGEVSAIYVSRRSRGKGAGRLLMQEGESYLKAFGCEKVYLMVTANNLAAVGLYEELGYQVTRLQMEKRLRT